MAPSDQPPIPPSPVIEPEDRPRAARTRAAPQRSLLARLLPFIIVALALGSFSGIVVYYYFAGSSSAGPDSAAPLVRAESRPEKIRPENPGGMEVPHQDKEIYDRVVAAGRSPIPPTAERLLPPPEAPLPRPGAPIGTGPTPPSTLSAAPPRPPGEPALGIPASPPVMPPASAPPAPVLAAPAPSPALPPAASSASPLPSPQVVAQPRQLAAGSGMRVAVASLRSEADARREWERLRRQHGEALLGLSADFAPIDLGEPRGVMWRIYVGPPESSADAQSRCNALKQRQVVCFVARP